MKQDSSSRRSFLKTTSVVATGITIIPRQVLGQGQTPPSQKLNIAGIGVGGMGSGDVASCAKVGENIVALCDPDRNHLAGNPKKTLMWWSSPRPTMSTPSLRPWR
jgi:hypothetical protein